MIESIFSFLKKGYKVILAIVGVTFFFTFYNFYLVDRSLVSLHIALGTLAQAQTPEEFNKIKPFIKGPLLNEVIKKNPSIEIMVALGAANNIADGPNALKQKDEIVLYLKNAVKKKETHRNKALVLLDKMNGYLFKGAEAIKREPNAAKAENLVSQLDKAQDDAARQNVAYNLGNIYFQSADFIKAAEAYLSCISYSADSQLSRKAKLNLAFSYRYMAEYEKSLLIFEELAKYNQDINLSVSSQFEAANTLYLMRRYKEARDKYAKLARNYPDFETAALALYRAGTISLYELNDFKGALEFFHKLSLSRAGSISYFDLKDIKEALKFISEIEKIFSRSDPVAIYARKGLRKIMSSEFQKRGYWHIIKKEYNMAVLSFKKALIIDPSDSLSKVGEAVALYLQGFKEEAYQKAKETIAMGADEDSTIINIIFVLTNSGFADAGIEIGEKTISNRLVKINKPQFFYNLGYAYVAKGKFDNAITYFNRAIRMDSSFVFAYNNLGCVFWSKKDYSSAIKFFQRAVNTDPSYSDAYFNLGIVYFELNRLEDSYREFQLALDANPQNKAAKSYIDNIEGALKYNPSELSVLPQQ